MPGVVADQQEPVVAGPLLGQAESTPTGTVPAVQLPQDTGERMGHVHVGDVDAGRPAGLAVVDEPGTAGYLAQRSVNRARDWTSFLAAAARWKLPTENLIYAEGNTFEDARLGFLTRFDGIVGV